MGKYIIGITGASGSIYGVKLIRQLLRMGHNVILTITESGKLVLDQEMDMHTCVYGSAEEIERYLRSYFCVESNPEKLKYYDIGLVSAPIASGSFRTDGMVVVPCSMATLSSIAHGASKNLLERAADVMMKERRRLIIVPREAPFNTIHLQNLLLLSQNNVQIIPASPPFYHKPSTIDELVDFFVGRVIDQLGIEHDFIERWAGIE